MPFGKTRTAATYKKEILRSVSGNELAENSVVDGAQVPLNGDGRRVLETGTVMVFSSGLGSKVRPAAASGILAADVAGIVMTTTEFWPDTNLTAADDKPLALFTKNCAFETSQLGSNYSGNAAAVKSAMTGAGNGRCANCSFE